jgi:hypothetical protein
VTGFQHAERTPGLAPVRLQAVSTSGDIRVQENFVFDLDIWIGFSYWNRLKRRSFGIIRSLIMHHIQNDFPLRVLAAAWPTGPAQERLFPHPQPGKAGFSGFAVKPGQRVSAAGAEHQGVDEIRASTARDCFLFISFFSKAKSRKLNGPTLDFNGAFLPIPGEASRKLQNRYRLQASLPIEL